MNQDKFDLLKSHIDAYTRKDGAYVGPYEREQRAKVTKEKFKAAHRMERLRDQSERGGPFDEDDVVKIRGKEVNLSRLPRDNMLAESAAFKLTNENKASDRNVKMAPGSVIAAKKVKELDAQDKFGSIFGYEEPISSGDAMSRARDHLKAIEQREGKDAVMAYLKKIGY